MTIEALITLAVSTGIGATVYGGLELAKPWLKIIAGLIYSVPVFKNVINALATWLRFDDDKSIAKLYDAVIKAIVFFAAWAIAWGMGVNGDLLVLAGYNTETSYMGFTLTALLIAFGDIITDNYEQGRK